MIGVPVAPYAYLLGQYLGDGCISEYRKGNPKLRLSTCDAYPGVRDECIRAIQAVVPAVNIYVIKREGCCEVGAAWAHWPCLFPQHGPGLKHHRPIRLESWQRCMALDERPDQLVRGLIHSDGWRGWNRVRGRGRQYQHVRYLFTSESADIRWLFIEACERLGVEARHNRRNSVSVARKDSVAILERVVGQKT